MKKILVLGVLTYVALCPLSIADADVILQTTPTVDDGANVPAYREVRHHRHHHRYWRHHRGGVYIAPRVRVYRHYYPREFYYPYYRGGYYQPYPYSRGGVAIYPY